MILSDTAIRRPVFTTMVIGAIVVFGVVSYYRVGVDLFPKVEFPMVTVTTVLRGADPATIETTVTDVIEEAVSTISGIKHLRSTSTEGLSMVMVEFELEKDVDIAFQEVQARLGAVRSQLPLDVEDPVTDKVAFDALPVLSIVVSGEMPIRDLTHMADKTIKERLQRIPGVGGATIIGGRDREIWVWLDRQKLEGHGLTVQEVQAALRAEHIEQPGGRLESGTLEQVVKTKAEFGSAAEFDDMVIAFRNGAPIRVRDVGHTEDGMEEERSIARLNGKRALSLEVRKQSGTNVVEVTEAVKAEVEGLRQEMKAGGVRLEIAEDMSVYIHNSLREVHHHLVLGGALAVAVVLIFLRNIRSTLISAVVLPTSVIGTFVMLNVMGFTQNVLTLLGLTLAIGLLIDDSIVVQENTMRHVEEGMSPRQAASFATNEIALAVFATTLSVVAVFVPVAFMEGIVGRFFYQFGLTVAFAVLISMFVSFTLDPMLSSRLLTKPHLGFFARLAESAFGLLNRGYAVLLRVALRYRWAVLLLGIASFLAAARLAKHLRFEFMPMEDQSEFRVAVSTPLGSRVSHTDRVLSRIADRLATQPWVAYTYSAAGADSLSRVTEGSVYVKMLDKAERTIGQEGAMEWARREFAGVRDAKISVRVVDRMEGAIGSGGKSGEVMTEIRGSDLDQLEAIAAKVMERMRATPGYVDIDTTFERGKPEVNVYVDRDRAADLGVSPAAVAGTVRALIGGEDTAKFRAGGDRYDVRVRLLEGDRSRPTDIGELTVRSANGSLQRLSNLVRIREESGPVQIDRYSRARQVTVVANLQRDKRVLGEALTEVTGWLQEAGLPPGYSFGFPGKAEAMVESFQNLVKTLVLAVIIIYMVLASQFESFLHPLTIMMTLPLSVVGAIGALLIFDMTMGIFTMIGIILLMGLVTKNAILLIDYTNTLRERDGMERNAAVLHAGPVRLRPVLMTTIAMIFGMMPTALGKGAGSEARGPMAMAVIGGLITSTLLTLVVVPVVYTYFDDLTGLLLRRWRTSQPAAAEPVPEPVPEPGAASGGQ